MHSNNTVSARAGRLHPFRIAVYVCAAISGFCFFEYLLSVIVYAGTFFSYALPITAVSVVVLPPLTEQFWQAHLPRKLFSAARAVYCFGVIFFVLTFGIFLAFLSSYEHTAVPNEGKTAVLVYGCRVKGTEPKEMLAERLDAALELLSANPESIALVSGATDEGEMHTEAQVMAWYLEKHGIASERILLDEEAESTKGNIRGFLRLMEEHDLQDVPCISVSSTFHMPRIAFLCGRYGLDSSYVGAKTVSLRKWFPSVVREYMAYVKMLVLNSYE
jgi:vancomycin permeability regulator SanA